MFTTEKRLFIPKCVFSYYGEVSRYIYLRS